MDPTANPASAIPAASPRPAQPLLAPAPQLAVDDRTAPRRSTLAYGYASAPSTPARAHERVPAASPDGRPRALHLAPAGYAPAEHERVSPNASFQAYADAGSYAYTPASRTPSAGAPQRTPSSGTPQRTQHGSHTAYAAPPTPQSQTAPSPHAAPHSAPPGTPNPARYDRQWQRAHLRTPSTEPPAPASPARFRSPSTKRRPLRRTSVGPWEFIKSIGAGSMGQVKLAMHTQTKQLAAVKIVQKAFASRSKDRRESNETRDARVVREAAIGRLLYHPNIAKLYDVYSMTSHFYLVFEFVSGGQILDYIITHGCVKETQAIRFARCIASALDYCHRNSVVHRDLKIENILINDDGDIQLIDFGLSNLFRRDDLLRTYCGSLYFAAPELLNAVPYVGPEIDIWSFGVVLYVLVSGKVPFEDKSMTMLHAKIKRGRVEYPSWLSSQCVDLLARMLTVNPSERATLHEVMHHPWMLRGYDTPPSNHVPPRLPLTLAEIEPAVIAEMEHVGIGDGATIYDNLHAVLTSAEYEESVRAWRDAENAGMPLRALSPLDAYAPEISCYFLARERLVRQRVSRQPTPASSSSSLERDVTPPSPPASLDTPLAVRRTRARTLGASAPPQLAVTAPSVTASAAPGLGAPAPLVGPVAPLAPVVPLVPPPLVPPLGSPAPAGLGLDTRVVSTPLPPAPPRALSPGYAAPKRAHSQHPAPAPPRSLLRKLSLRRKSHTRAKSTSYAQAVPDLSAPELSPAPSGGDMPSIEYLKPIFFRGIFSVQSTSTKPLKEIRAEIIRVLVEMHIDYVEVRGGFACVFRPFDPVARSSSLAPPSPATPPRSPKHRRMVSDNGVLSPQLGANLSSGSGDSIEMEIGASDMLNQSSARDSVPVRFELDIVRVPILGIHGVQFKKMTGNMWRYKNIAQEILHNLRL